MDCIVQGNTYLWTFFNKVNRVVEYYYHTFTKDSKVLSSLCGSNCIAIFNYKLWKLLSVLLQCVSESVLKCFVFYWVFRILKFQNELLHMLYCTTARYTHMTVLHRTKKNESFVDLMSHFKKSDIYSKLMFWVKAAFSVQRVFVKLNYVSLCATQIQQIHWSDIIPN